MLKNLSKIVLIGLIVGATSFGYLSAQNDTNEPEWTRDPRAWAKQMATFFLEAYNQKSKPLGQDIQFWIIEVKKSSGWLRRLGDMRVVEPFIEILKDTVHFADEIHSCAAIAFGQLRDKRAIPILKKCLNNRSRELTRMESAIALCFLGETKIAIPVVEEYAKRDSPPYNPLGQGISELVSAFFTFDNEPVRLPKDNELLIKYMERALKFPSKDLRIDAAFWLVKQDKKRFAKRVFEVASELLLNRKEKSAIRQIAIGVLSIIGDEASKGIISKVANDEDKFVAEAAKETLKKLGGER